MVVEFILKRQLPLGQTVQNSIANQVTLTLWLFPLVQLALDRLQLY